MKETKGSQSAKTARARRAAPSFVAVPSPTAPGRTVAQPRKTSINARESLADVFERMGGVNGLYRWARKNPSQFYLQLWPRLIPKDMTLTPGAGLEEMLERLAGAPLRQPGDNARVIEASVIEPESAE